MLSTDRQLYVARPLGPNDRHRCSIDEWKSYELRTCSPSDRSGRALAGPHDLPWKLVAQVDRRMRPFDVRRDRSAYHPMNTLGGGAPRIHALSQSLSCDSNPLSVGSASSSEASRSAGALRIRQKMSWWESVHRLPEQPRSCRSFWTYPENVRLERRFLRNIKRITITWS